VERNGRTASKWRSEEAFIPAPRGVPGALGQAGGGAFLFSSRIAERLKKPSDRDRFASRRDRAGSGETMGKP